MLLGFAAVAQADEYWSVQSGDWSNAANWGGTLPTSTYQTWTYIQNGGTANITTTGPVCFALSVGDTTGSGTVQMTAGSLSVNSYEYIGVYGTGTFNQSGGTNTLSGGQTVDIGLYIGGGSLYSGTYNLSGGQLNVNNREYIGLYGPCTFNQSGGTNTITSGTLYLGQYSGSGGTYNLTGGMLTTASIGSGSGTAAFNFGGGTLKANGTLSTTLPMTLTGSGGNATVDTASYTVTLSGAVSGPGGLTKTDSGMLLLATANTYSGNTLVSGGTRSGQHACPTE